MIRDEGLDPTRIRVFVGPAGGPKWFVSVGFDRALISAGLLGRSAGRVILAGASAGAWRCITMACREPLEAHEKLRVAYSRNIFTAADTPITVGRALAQNVEDFLSPQDGEFIVNHPMFDLAVHTVRGHGPGASENQKIQGVALIAGALLNVLSPSGVERFFKRVVFFSGPEKPRFLNSSFRGEAVKLSARNIQKAALATGSLPYVVAGVQNISEAPAGVYRDGGLTDYQLNQDYCPGDGGLTLFFHYQERIIPGWFDKPLKWRTPPRATLTNVLQVYPGPDFIKLLPDRRLPDRNDFKKFVNDPVERIRRWDEISETSEVLGETFINDVESGRIRNLVQPL
ncbi:MAG: hypothetical protein HY913_09675 [Desulfomonile tiedjei]|nr:hypothetical protein [Desulfomonile tiedjei]